MKTKLTFSPFTNVGLIGLASVLCVLLFPATAAHAEDKVNLDDPKIKASYAMGVNMATSYKRQEIELDPQALAQGMKDVMSGGKSLLSEEDVRKTLQAYYQEARAKATEKRKQIAEKNKQEGATFLAANAKKEGVKTLPSGLQYKVLTEGTGPMPGTNDTVTTQYRGTLIDGTEFDSSFKRGTNATFSVNRVIKGWTEALGMMKVGSKWQLFIPSNLAYGDSGTRDIPPGSTLIFEIELVGTATAPAPTVGQVAQPGQPVTSDIIKVPSAEELKKGAKIEVIKQPPTPDNK